MNLLGILVNMNNKDKRVRVTPEAYRAIRRMAKDEKRTLRQTLELCVLAREIHVKSRTSESLDVRGKKEEGE